MYSQKVVVTNSAGLHARPASMFVQAAAKFKSNMTIKKGDKSASPKSIIGVLSLGASKNSEVIITAEGEDEKEAVDTLVNLIKSKFGEE